MEAIRYNYTTLGIANLPERKKPCLVLVEDNVITKLASFNDEDSAELFFNALLKLTDCDTKDTTKIVRR